MQGLPRLRFNKEGNLLAVTTADNGIKILANASGMRSLRTVEAPPFEALRAPLEAAANKVLIYRFKFFLICRSMTCVADCFALCLAGSGIFYCKCCS